MALLKSTVINAGPSNEPKYMTTELNRDMTDRETTLKIEGEMNKQMG